MTVQLSSEVIYHYFFFLLLAGNYSNIGDNTIQ